MRTLQESILDDEDRVVDKLDNRALLLRVFNDLCEAIDDNDTKCASNILSTLELNMYNAEKLDILRRTRKAINRVTELDITTRRFSFSDYVRRDLRSILSTPTSNIAEFDFCIKTGPDRPNQIIFAYDYVHSCDGDHMETLKVSQEIANSKYIKRIANRLTKLGFKLSTKEIDKDGVKRTEFNYTYTL